MANRRDNKAKASELELSDKENKKDKTDKKRKKASSSSGSSSDSSSGSESSSDSSSSGSSSGSSSRSSSSSSSSSSSGYSDGNKRKKPVKKVSKSPSATRVVDEKKTKLARERDEKIKKPERPRPKVQPNRSASPRRKRVERSPTPRPTKIHIGRLTRNITREHIREIFSTFGNIKAVDFPLDRNHPNLGKGFAYAEFETADDAENAMKHMDGGQIDGQEITAAPVLIPRPRAIIQRRLSPLLARRPMPRWGGGRLGPRFRHNSPPRPRIRTPPRRRPRSRPRSPARRRRYSRTSSSTSR